MSSVEFEYLFDYYRYLQIKTCSTKCIFGIILDSFNYISDITNRNVNIMKIHLITSYKIATRCYEFRGATKTFYNQTETIQKLLPAEQRCNNATNNTSRDKYA